MEGRGGEGRGGEENLPNFMTAIGGVTMTGSWGGGWSSTPLTSWLATSAELCGALIP